MTSRVDLAEWQEYVRLELQRYGEHTGDTGYIWADTPAAARHAARSRILDPGERAFTGAWHTVRPYVTLEFRQWVEEYKGTERLTLSQWLERQRAERDAVEWLDSAAHTLDRLDEIRRLTLERDALILEGARRGASKVDIARAAGISRQAVHAVIARALDALEPAGDTLAPVTPITAAYAAHTADTVPYAATGTYDGYVEGEPF